MKIAFFRLEDWEKTYITEHQVFQEMRATSVFIEEPLDKDHVPAETDAEVISIFIDSAITKEVLDAFPKLKLIAARSTGYDHIDLAACKERGVAVVNVPVYGEHTVAEYTFGLILALSRKIYESYDRIRETGSFRLDGLRGFDLKGKTLGVVGTGNIGRNVVKIATAFEMNVIACDLYPDVEFAQKMGFAYCEPEKALVESDIVTLHVPYSKETHHLVNKNNIWRMKRGAILVNTSRGQIVQTEALVKALKEGHLGGAALDVLEEEGVIKDELEVFVEGRLDEHNLKTVLANHILINMPNVIVTPHNAFNTWEALSRILDTTLYNIKEFMEGEAINVLKVEKK